ncbi:helix-turn-helix domain-containing protein [Haloarcula nitratireducens]|uniref:Helix-turn-helix domain-containing protein n=1 Tax=Haloarcula nitratireducens TaxID=2487749 RepID=A0AAW4PJ27_9EURY|nr:helix-turn-helix domain-containing protein [Halomicroarcula nitratireducens]MBX0297953.1 helix-turn-helix domain-containing protein [Halomicroarcula nitratireducens]
MTTLVSATVPACEIALADVFASLSDVDIEAERIVEGGDDIVMPLLWIRNADRDEFEAACAGDPTVDEIELLADFETELLYRMQWIDQVGLLLQMLTNANASILEAVGKNGTWHLRILYPSREQLAETKTFCSEHELSLTINAIREMDGEPSGRYGLTTGQYQALVTAVNAGYFAVPSDITLNELADEMNISHQALSERLRRGIHALIEDTLLLDFAESNE